MVVQLSQINEYLGSSNMIYDNSAHTGYMSIQLMMLTYDFGNAWDGQKPTYDDAQAGYMSVQLMLLTYDFGNARDG